MKKGVEKLQFHSSFTMGFSLLNMTEFFVFRKTESCETKNPLLCGGRQQVLHKNHLSARIIEGSSHYYGKER